ncbi:MULTISPECIES: type II secretion system F family protein [Limibacillus]|jgi:tight adherence protein B|uniref:Tight adherence protein B n=1 Tax=Limibacillus halophilus TaxID=1579333 RepID=A0A839SXM8_9PROT|nr:type II secretion system F family protein [Limibacillus halophilus]MBB3066286.1 tight adherence protein B [Limibacillus halophilus]
METTTIIILGVVFLVSFLLIEGLYFLISDWRKSKYRQMNRRMAMLSEGRSSQEVMLRLRRESAYDAQGNILEVLANKLDGLLAQSGAGVSIPQLFMICTMFSLISVGAFFVLQALNPLTIAVSVILPFLLPLLILKLVRGRRISKFNEQLPECIDVVVRALRAGHPISSAIGLAASELPDPIGSEFGLAVDEMQYGLDLNESLTNMEKRVGSPDLRMLVITVQIQGEIGGNLAEILSSISRVIRERFKIRRKAKALSAEGRFSAIVLGILPIAVFLAINVLSPKYYTLVQDDQGFIISMGIGMILMFIGYFVMYRMTNFKI